jgi:uncharacterized protein (DUF2147 family)
MRIRSVRSRTARSGAINWLAVLAMLAPWPGSACAQTPGPAGLWTTYSDSTGKPDGLVRITEANGVFTGIVVGVLSATDPSPVCDLCEGELKGKPVVGMAILRGLRREGESYGGGTILDPDDGRIYRCKALLRDSGARLEIRGYLGAAIFGRTQVWVRRD